MTTYIDKILLECLLKVKRQKKERSWGICYSVLTAAKLDQVSGINHLVDKLDALFETWPKFSGDSEFPVPSPLISIPDKEEAYIRLPKWTGRYGRLRIQLLNHCIRELKKEL
jgi:hypothetical protein